MPPSAESAAPVARGTGERTLDVAENLAFQQILRNSGCIDGHERPLGAAGQPVQRFGADLLARSAFTRDEDGGIRWRGPLQDAVDALHGARPADEAGQSGILAAIAACRCRRAFSGSGRCLVRRLVRAPGIDRIADRLAQALAIEGLDEEIVGAQTHHIHGDADRGIGRDDHDRGGYAALLQPGHDVDSAHVRQVHVKDDAVIFGFADLRQGVFARAGQVALAANRTQETAIGFRKRRAVFDHQDLRVFHCNAPQRVIPHSEKLRVSH